MDLKKAEPDENQQADDKIRTEGTNCCGWTLIREREVYELPKDPAKTVVATESLCPQTVDEIIGEQVQDVQERTSRSAIPKQILACRLVRTEADKVIDNIPVDGSPTPRWKNVGVEQSEDSVSGNLVPDLPEDCALADQRLDFGRVWEASEQECQERMYRIGSSHLHQWDLAKPREAPDDVVRVQPFEELPLGARGGVLDRYTASTLQGNG